MLVSQYAFLPHFMLCILGSLHLPPSLKRFPRKAFLGSSSKSWPLKRRQGAPMLYRGVGCRRRARITSRTKNRSPHNSRSSRSNDSQRCVCNSPKAAALKTQKSLYCIPSKDRYRLKVVGAPAPQVQNYAEEEQQT